MNVTALSLERIRELACNCLAVNGCNHDNASALADTLTDAERDGCTSHGLFRMGGYVAGLRSGKVKGAARPKLQNLTSLALRMDGDGGYAPLALQQGCPALAKAARAQGVAVLALVRSFHFASLWHEAEALAAEGLVALCCTAYCLRSRRLVQASLSLAPTPCVLLGRGRGRRRWCTTWPRHRWPRGRL